MKALFVIVVAMSLFGCLKPSGCFASDGCSESVKKMVSKVSEGNPPFQYRLFTCGALSASHVSETCQIGWR